MEKRKIVVRRKVCSTKYCNPCDSDYLYSLKQLCDDKMIKIPDVQRGEVWTPSQKGLLWDSILNYYPIGGFIFSIIEDNQIKYKNLLDGQQRLRTIQLGFENPSKTNSNSVLWYMFEEKNKEYEYEIRITTKAHPWGYNKGGSHFNTYEIANAINYLWDGKRSYSDIYKINNGDFFPLDSFPISFNGDSGEINTNCIMIPLAYVINGLFESNSCDEFIKWIVDHINSSSQDFLLQNWKIKKWNPNKELIISILKNNYDYLIGIKNIYKISCNYFYGEKIIKNKKTSEKDVITKIFRRINEEGTKITQEDYAYSAIKLFWPKFTKYIADNNRNPQKFNNMDISLIIFRLYETIENYNKDIKEQNENRNILQKGITAEGIQSLSQRNINDEVQKKLIRYFDKYLMNIVETKLCDKSSDNYLLPYIKMSLIDSRPDVYLLLIFICYSYSELDNFSGINLKSIALFLFIFTRNNKDCQNCVDLIIQEIKLEKQKLKCENIPKLIKQAVCKMYMENSILSIPDVEQLFSDEYKDTLSIITSWDREEARCLLLNFQKDLIIEEFSAYDPCDSQMWGDYNRPWDYDHIIPKSIINHNSRKLTENEKEKLKKAQILLNQIGNIAAIPFGANRSKNNSINLDYYQEKIIYKNKNVCRSELLQINTEFIKHDFINFFSDKTYLDEDKKPRVITYNRATKLITLEQIIKERTATIYKSFYTSIKQFIPKETDLDLNMKKRKKIFESLKQSYFNYFYQDDNEWRDVEIGSSHKIKIVDWTRKKILREYTNLTVSEFLAVAIYKDYEEDFYRIGLRNWASDKNQSILSKLKKIKLEYYLDDDDDEWWYMYFDVKESDIENAHLNDKISKLVEIAKKL